MKSFSVLITVDNETTLEEVEELVKSYFDGEKEYETIEHRYICPLMEYVGIVHRANVEKKN